MWIWSRFSYDPKVVRTETAEIATMAHRSERTFAVIVNASAGALARASGPEDAIRAAFADEGLTPLFIGKEAGDLPARMVRARDSGAAAIVVAGGDGIVACAARVSAGGAMPLGILPFGTMNLLIMYGRRRRLP